MSTSQAGFDRHVATLVASWEAFAAAAGGEVVRVAGYVAARHPNPVFNNALLLEPEPVAVAAAEATYASAGIGEWAVWTADDATADVARAAGLRPDVTTCPMLAVLRPRPRAADAAGVREVDPAEIAELNDLPGELVAGVAGLRALAAADGSSGLLWFEHDGDINISFVATHPGSRGRGLASAVVSAALVRAQGAGASTATLQATPMGAGLYRRLGFEPVGTWQEWKR